MNIVRLILLCYLSFAVAMPSYTGLGNNGHEFHFFGLTESTEDHGHHCDKGPQLEPVYDMSGHDHSHIYFLPSNRIYTDMLKHRLAITYMIETDDYYSAARTSPESDIRNPSACMNHVYGHNTSGVSPPLIPRA